MNIVALTRCYLEHKGFLWTVTGCFGRNLNIIFTKDSACVLAIIDQVFKGNVISRVLNQCKSCPHRENFIVLRACSPSQGQTVFPDKLNMLLSSIWNLRKCNRFTRTGCKNVVLFFAAFSPVLIYNIHRIMLGADGLEE